MQVSGQIGAGARALAGLREVADPATRVERLDNGALLVVEPIVGAPAVNVRIGTAAGAFQDPPGLEGAAHLFEHLAFETSGTYDVAQIRSMRRTLGGVSNALTSLERVHLEATVAPRDARAATRLLTDLYAHPSTDPAALERQRAIALDELLAGYSGKDRHAQIELRNLLYGADSPHARWPLGTRDSIQRLTQADRLRYLDTAITGNNTVALLSGDPAHLPVAQLRADLGRLDFGVRETDPAFRGFAPGARWTSIPHDGRGTAQLDVVFPQLPGASAKGRGELAEVLGERLRTRLREQDHLLYAVSVAADVEGKGSGLATSLVLPAADVRAGVRALAEEVQSLATRIPDAELDEVLAMQRAKAAMAGTAPQPRGMAAYTTLVTADRVNADVADQAGLVPREAKATDPITADQRAATARDLLSFANVRMVLHGAVAGREGDVPAGLRDAGVAVDRLEHVPHDAAAFRRAYAGD